MNEAFKLLDREDAIFFTEDGHKVFYVSNFTNGRRLRLTSTISSGDKLDILVVDDRDPKGWSEYRHIAPTPQHCYALHQWLGRWWGALLLHGPDLDLTQPKEAPVLCDECCTGFYKGFGHTCSKGCK